MMMKLEKEDVEAEDLSALEEGYNNSSLSSRKTSTPAAAPPSVKKSKTARKSSWFIDDDSNCNKFRDVNNFFLIRKICDDDAEGLNIVGTMIQMVFGRRDADGTIQDDEFHYFPYCFNEEDAEECATVSRTTEYMVKCEEGQDEIPMRWSKFNVKAPLDLTTISNCFPFRILKATLTIELGAVATRSGHEQVRPNLLIHANDTRNNISLVEVDEYGGADKSLLKSQKKMLRHTTELLCEKLDQTRLYDLVSPYPEICYLHDRRRGNCAIAKVSFYVFEGNLHKFIKVTIPMALIACMNSVNVYLFLQSEQNGEETSHRIEGSDYLANSATFALTAVFLLPEIFAASKQVESTFSLNNVYILTVFLALALSSIPYLPTSITGMSLLWLSFLFPFWNTRSFLQTRTRMVEQMQLHKELFVKDKQYKGWKPDRENCFFEDFKQVSAMKGEKRDLYHSTSLTMGNRYLALKYSCFDDEEINEERDEKRGEEKFEENNAERI